MVRAAVLCGAILVIAFLLLALVAYFGPSSVVIGPIEMRPAQ